MPLNRRFRLSVVLLAASMLVLPAPAAAADPTLGEAVTLPDGTVLPPMPPEMLGPSIHSEMDARARRAGSRPPPAIDRGRRVTWSSSRPHRSSRRGDRHRRTRRIASERPDARGPRLPAALEARRHDPGRAPLRPALDDRLLRHRRTDRRKPEQVQSRVERVGVGRVTAVMNAAHARGVKVVPTVTFMTSNGDYGPLTTLLNTPAHRGRLVGEITSLIRDRGADGVNIDFEPVPASLRSQMTSFIRELKAGLVERPRPLVSHRVDDGRRRRLVDRLRRRRPDRARRRGRAHGDGL